MTLNQLLYFYQAASLEHFNLAAKALHISEPSLSRSIRFLEEELGVQLFEKKGRNIVLTKAGRIFLVHVEKILKDISYAKTNMKEYALDGGKIEVAYVAPLSRNILPAIIRSFLDDPDNQKVVFNFYQGYTEENLAGLKNGTYDVIFGSNLSEQPGINIIPIMQRNMVVIMSADHPLANRKYIDHTAFSQYPVLKYDSQSSLGVYSNQYFQSYNVVPNTVFEFPDEESIASFVSQGFGIALVADVYSIYRDNIVIRPLVPQEKMVHTVSMATMNNNVSPASLQRLIQHVKDHFEKHFDAL